MAIYHSILVRLNVILKAFPRKIVRRRKKKLRRAPSQTIVMEIIYKVKFPLERIAEISIFKLPQTKWKVNFFVTLIILTLFLLLMLTAVHWMKVLPYAIFKFTALFHLP